MGHWIRLTFIKKNELKLHLNTQYIKYQIHLIKTSAILYWDLWYRIKIAAKSFVQKNRHGSFAPVRSDQHGSWFVDGSSLFSAIAEVIEAAKEEIFITDWWLSPEIYLKRGLEFDPQKRLDHLLATKAVRESCLWSTRPTHSHDHCFHTCRPPVRSYFSKRNKFQEKMFATGETVGLAEWIIDYT